MLRRPLALLAATLVALALVPAALAAVVHVRIEGKTRTLFGATDTLAAGATPLEVLESASIAGELYYHVTASSFGRYVDQIGRYPASGTAGWVFKVNGVSPPVGADQVQLKDGDTVLWYWAQFGIAPGGPPTLVVRRTAPGCYAATGQDDQGQAKVPSGLVFHVGTRMVPAPAGHVCPKSPHGLVWATAPGAVRSNRLP